MEVQKELIVQNLNLSTIKPDPNQPRKSFNELSLKLLSESIMEHGIQQPITVRPNGKGFVIVMGERRFRASKLANMKTIPCIVKDFDSKVISEIQIIENLQREDVEPMEEAEAIAVLLEKYKPEEIAKRIGRTVPFIYGRIKLANLIEGFRPYVRNNEMTLSMAITVAIFPKEDQEIFLEGMGKSYKSHYINNAVNNKMYDLNEAPFDLEDSNLVPKAGACTLCPFNSANQGNLFGSEKKICTKTTCFNSKKSKSLISLFEQVKNDRRLLVGNFKRYNMDSEENQLVFSLMQENGLNPYLLNDIEYINEPLVPTKEAIQKNRSWMEFTDDELQEELDEAMVEYNEELEEFKNAPKNGFKIGLLLNTDTYGTQEVLMKIIEKETVQQENVSLEKKKMDSCTPKEKIEKINIRETRKKHIEDNRQFKEIIEKVSESDYINSKKGLTIDEMVAFTISMYENMIGFSNRNKNMKGFYGKDNSKSSVKTVENFKKSYKKETFNKLVRMLLVENVHFEENNHNNNVTNISVYSALRPFCKETIENIEKAYEEARTTREKKLQARIEELESKINTDSK